MANLFVILFVCLMVLILNSDCAITKEGKQALILAYKPIIVECSKEHGISNINLDATEETANVEGTTNCFFGCTFKKLEIINAEGKVDITNTLEKLKGFIKGDEDFTKFQKIATKCSSVNEIPVSDGATGCERAQLLLKCFLQNKAELPL